MNSREPISEFISIAARGQIPVKVLERQFTKVRTSFQKANEEYIKAKRDREQAEREETSAKDKMEKLKKETEDLRETIRDADHMNAKSIKRRKDDLSYVVDGMEYVRTPEGFLPRKEFTAMKQLNSIQDQTMDMSEAVEDEQLNSVQDQEDSDDLLLGL